MPLIIVSMASTRASLLHLVLLLNNYLCYALAYADRVEVPDLSVSGDTLDLWK
jgi:hypothetical protein